MRTMTALAALTAALIACSAPAPAGEASAQTPRTQISEPAAAPPFVTPPQPQLEPIVFSDAPASGDTANTPPPAAPVLTDQPVPGQMLAPRCDGALMQGGLAVCRTAPGASVAIGEDVTQADAAGLVVVGFDWGAPPQETLTISADGQTHTLTLDIAPRTFRTTVINGVPQQNVTPNEVNQARIARDRVHINRGYASQDANTGFLDGFIWPVEGRISSAWGAQRIINGTPGRPHHGVDIAMPTGTPIRAPAGGVVSLAQPDLFQEGGLVMIDHGQGLISLYLHMSRLDVTEGQRISQGDVIGTVGSSGRATGPHVCWRMKWRGRYLDPSLAILGLAQARRTLSQPG